MHFASTLWMNCDSDRKMWTEIARNYEMIFHPRQLEMWWIAAILWCFSWNCIFHLFFSLFLHVCDIPCFAVHMVSVAAVLNYHRHLIGWICCRRGGAKTLMLRDDNDSFHGVHWNWFRYRSLGWAQLQSISQEIMKNLTFTVGKTVWFGRGWVEGWPTEDLLFFSVFLFHYFAKKKKIVKRKWFGEMRSRLFCVFSWKNR